MNSLETYYSRTGTTRKVAEKISALLEGDIKEIRDTMNRSGLMGWLKAGRDSSAAKLTKLEGVKKDQAHYDVVVFGTPIWNHTLSTPIKTYISEYRERFKEVAFFCTGASIDNDIFPEMEALCGKNPVTTLRFRRRREVENGRYSEKNGEFVTKLKVRQIS